MIDDAVARGVTETAELDWKSKLPPQKSLAQSDVAKDIAAMANSGGGIIIFGVQESNKAAIGREDAGDADENYERTLRRVAYSAITPPVTGLQLHRIGDVGNRAVAVVIPDSPDAPHLLYREQVFGAPVRNDSDTEWMKERTLEAAYRQRFNTARDAQAVLERLYEECVRAHNPRAAVTLIGVARPRYGAARGRRPRADIAQLVYDASILSRRWTVHPNALSRSATPIYPLDGVDPYRPRTGLRRWTAQADSDPSHLTAHAGIHDDGSVTLGWSAGGQWSEGPDRYPANELTSGFIETFVTNLLALVKAVADTGPGGDVEIRIGLEWAGDLPALCHETTPHGRSRGTSGLFGGKFTPVDAVVSPSSDEGIFFDSVRAIAEDCVSQFDVHQLSVLLSPPLPPLQ